MGAPSKPSKRKRDRGRIQTIRYYSINDSRNTRNNGKEPKNNGVDLSAILHKHNSNIFESEKSAAYLYLALRIFNDGEKNIVQKITLLRFLSDKLLKDIITDKSLPTEVIIRAGEEENFIKEISPSHYKNLSTEEEIEICTYGKLNDLYNLRTRRTGLNIVKKYLTRIYGKEF